MPVGWDGTLLLMFARVVAATVHSISFHSYSDSYSRFSLVFSVRGCYGCSSLSLSSLPATIPSRSCSFRPWNPLLLHRRRRSPLPFPFPFPPFPIPPSPVIPPFLRPPQQALHPAGLLGCRLRITPAHRLPVEGSPAAARRRCWRWTWRW